MDHVVILVFVILFSVIVLAVFAKGVRLFGLRISWRDGMTVNFESNPRDEQKESEKKKVFSRLDELQEPWGRGNVSSSTTPQLPIKKDPPTNNLLGKQFMSDDYTASLLASFKENAQGEDTLYFDDGLSQELENI